MAPFDVSSRDDWTKLFEDGLNRHWQLGLDEGYRKGYKEGYLAAVNEMDMAHIALRNNG
jgi:flagellar biosynthesis/type III secretory pathway protein FliH